MQSQSDFDACRTPRCAYVLVVKTRRLGRFWPVSWTITQFWGPEVISTINKPHGAFKCRSSTLVVFIDSGPFHGLLLIFLGSQSDFHGCRTPRCAYVSVVNNRSFGRFWPVSLTITQCWAHVVISTTDEHRGEFTCRSSTLTILADSGTFCALLLTVVGSRSDFHD